MDLEASMRKSLESTQRTFNTIRTGRANPPCSTRFPWSITALKHR